MIGRDAVASVHAEGEGSVCCSVAHSGGEQGQEVCGLRSHEHLEDQIQQRIGNGGGDSDGDETQYLSGGVGFGHVFLGGKCGELLGLNFAGHQTCAYPPHALDVFDGSVNDVDARVGVVDPVDRNFVDAVPGFFGEKQQLRVKKPGIVLHMGQQACRDVGTHGFEPALCVAEVCSHGCFQHEVVGAGNEFPLRPALHTGGTRKAGANGNVGMPGEQWGHERKQAVEVGG